MKKEVLIIFKTGFFISRIVSLFHGVLGKRKGLPWQTLERIYLISLKGFTSFTASFGVMITSLLSRSIRIYLSLPMPISFM